MHRTAPTTKNVLAQSQREKAHGGRRGNGGSRTATGSALQARRGLGCFLKAGGAFFPDKQLPGSRESQEWNVLGADIQVTIFIPNVEKEILVLNKNPYGAK